jgi:hypothetical protein
MTEDRLVAIPLLLWGLTVASCDPEGAGSVGGRADVFDHRTQQVLASDLASANGTYGDDCANRTGSWSLELSTGATLDHPALTVVRNDAACVLTLTELRTASGALAATPTIELSDSYQGAPSEFGSPVEFYANAKLSSLSFAGDFVLTILFSDDSDLASGDSTATFAVHTATTAAQSVDAPNYTLDVTGLLIQTDINDVVQSAAGSALLNAGAVSGTRYVVVAAADLDSYDEVDAAYLGATSAAIASSIPASAFALVSDDLTTAKKRTLIVANIASGVRSYQVFEVTFNAPDRI